MTRRTESCSTFISRPLRAPTCRGKGRRSATRLTTSVVAGSFLSPRFSQPSDEFNPSVAFALPPSGSTVEFILAGGEGGRRVIFGGANGLMLEGRTGGIRN